MRADGSNRCEEAMEAVEASAAAEGVAAPATAWPLDNDDRCASLRLEMLGLACGLMRGVVVEAAFTRVIKGVDSIGALIGAERPLGAEGATIPPRAVVSPDVSASSSC